MNEYLSFSIHERINFKAYYMGPYRGWKGVFREADGNPDPYQKNSENKFGW